MPDSVTTGEQLPRTPGSVATDARGRRYACGIPYWGIVRWFPLTHGERRPPTPEELAERDVTVDYVAPAWTGPGPPPVEPPG